MPLNPTTQPQPLPPKTQPGLPPAGLVPSSEGLGGRGRPADPRLSQVGAGGPRPGSFPGAGALTMDTVLTSCSQGWGPQHSPHPHWLPLTWKRSRLRQAFSRWPSPWRVGEGTRGLSAGSERQ